MKERCITKFNEVKAVIEESKALGKFNLEKLLSNENNLINVGKSRGKQLFLGDADEFNALNNYVIELINSTKDIKKRQELEEIQSVIWHFRQLQEKQNSYKVENDNLVRLGLHKVDFPSNCKNDDGEDYDFESRTNMVDVFTLNESCICNHEEKLVILSKVLCKLSSKQQLIIKEILQNNTQAEICIKYKMSKASVSNLYNRAIEKIKELLFQNN